MNTIGAKIRTLRGAAGLTQETLAEKAGIHRVTLANIEADTYKAEIGLNILKRIERALGLPEGILK